ncbi:unnamed protein product [Lampetra fluviatilis]
MLLMMLMIANQTGDSAAIPGAERPQRHVDGMFTSELSRLQSARLVQKYAMDIMRMRPEKGMDDDEDEEELLGHAARRGEGGGWKGGGQVPPRTDVVLNDEPSRDGDFVAVFVDGFSRHVLPSLEGRHPGDADPLRGAGEAAAPGETTPATRAHVVESQTK